MMGINKSLSESPSTKIKAFVQKLNLVGSSYLLSWPITVLIVEMLLPVHLHKDIINFVE